MATNIVQMTDGAGNKQYPVTSAEAVGMPDGSGNLQNYLNKRVTELNISVLYPIQGIGGTNRYTLAGAIAQVPADYRTFVGLKITFINNETSKPETWKYNGGTFTTTTNWVQGDGSGGNKTLDWAGDVASTRKQVLSQDRKKLLQISYTNGNGEIVNEQYKSTNYSDTEWVKDSNWLPIVSQYQLSPIEARSGFFECNTVATINYKSLNIQNFILNTKCHFLIKMTYKNTSNLVTLNINNTGAKPLFLNGRRVGSSHSWDAGDILEVYFDGENYQAKIYNDTSINLLWNTDTATTRLQIPYNKRFAGMLIKYKDFDGRRVNEQYVGEAFSDTQWAKDENWLDLLFLQENIIYHTGNLQFQSGIAANKDGSTFEGNKYASTGKIPLDDNVYGLYVKKLTNEQGLDCIIFYDNDTILDSINYNNSLTDKFIIKPKIATHVLINSSSLRAVVVDNQVVGLVYKGCEVSSDFNSAAENQLIDKKGLLPIKNTAYAAYDLSPKFVPDYKVLSAADGAIVIKSDGSQITSGSRLEGSTGYMEIIDGYRYSVSQTRAATGCYPVSFFKKIDDDYILLGGLGLNQNNYIGEFVPKQLYNEATHIAFTVYLNAGNYLELRLRPDVVPVTYNFEGNRLGVASSYETKLLLDYVSKFKLDKPGNPLIDSDNFLNPYECRFDGLYVWSNIVSAKEGEIIYTNGNIFRCFDANGLVIASSQTGNLESGQVLPINTNSVQAAWKPSGIEMATMDSFMALKPYISYLETPARYQAEFNPYLINIYDSIFRDLYLPFYGKTMFNIGDSMTMQASAYWGGSYMGTISKYTGLVNVGNTGTWGNGKALSDFAKELIDNTQGFREKIAKADIVTIYLGTNDYGHSDKEPGTVYDDYDSGTVTIMSCVKSIIKSILECNPYAIPIFFSQPERQDYVDNINPPTPTPKGLNMYVISNAIQEACKFVGVPFCDTHSLCYITMQTTDQYTVDGLHIGVQSTGQYIGKIMAKFINNLDWYPFRG